MGISIQIDHAMNISKARRNQISLFVTEALSTEEKILLLISTT